MAGNRFHADPNDSDNNFRAGVAGLLGDARAHRGRCQISEVAVQPLPAAGELAGISRRHAFAGFDSRQREGDSGEVEGRE